MHLRQSGFTCTACGPFIKNKNKPKKMQKFKETENSWYAYQNELYKAGLQYDMA